MAIENAESTLSDRYTEVELHAENDAVDVVAVWDKKPRGHGQYAQTKAFAVVLSPANPRFSA